jgi:peptidyl-prolyl cis-trans isomerase C
MRLHLSCFAIIALLAACAPADDLPSTGLAVVAHDENDPVVARVDGTELFQSDVEVAAQAQSLIEAGDVFPPSDPDHVKVLEELIDQRLLALDAVEQGLQLDPEVQLRLAAARERVLGNIRVERHLQNTVNEASIRRMYDEQSKLAARGDEVRARHILTETKAEADALLKRIVAGDNFGTLARTESIDAGSAERGGDLGYFTADMLSADFTTPVFAAAKGARLGPIKSEFGWHIIEVQDRRPAPQPTFETMRPKIVNFMTFDAIQGLVKDLRDTAEIEKLTPTPNEASPSDTPDGENPDED